MHIIYGFFWWPPIDCPGANNGSDSNILLNIIRNIHKIAIEHVCMYFFPLHYSRKQQQPQRVQPTLNFFFIWCEWKTHTIWTCWNLPFNFIQVFFGLRSKSIQWDFWLNFLWFFWFTFDDKFIGSFFFSSFLTKEPIYNFVIVYM